MKTEEAEKYRIFLFVRGSHAYGTNIETSDTDYGGITLPPNREILYGFERFDEINKGWGVDATGKELDKTIYNFPKVINLLINNNPNMMEYLFCADRSIVQSSPEWERIREIRNSFISKKCKYSYQGYAVSQLHRLERHRIWIQEGELTIPTRAQFGLPEHSIFPETQIESVSRLSTDYVSTEHRSEFMEEMTDFLVSEATTIFRKHMEDENLARYALEDMKRTQASFMGMLSSISGCFLKDEYKDMAGKELQYAAARRLYREWLEWKATRNPHRMELEKKIGYDGKHGMHCLRLLTNCVEILQGKGINVDRTGIDAEYLIAIRNGNVPYSDLIAETDRLSALADDLYKTTDIPYTPDVKTINSVKMDIIDRHATRLVDTVTGQSNFMRILEE